MPDQEQFDTSKRRVEQKPHREVEARKTHGGLGQKDRQGTVKTGSIAGPDVIVGRDVPDESEERHTEIAVEAGRKGVSTATTNASGCSLADSRPWRAF